MFLATDHAGYHQWAHDMVASQQLEEPQQQQQQQYFHQEPADLFATGSDSSNVNNSNDNDSSGNSYCCAWQEVKPVPNRREWLPAISHYEQKAWDDGRQTILSCWKPD